MAEALPCMGAENENSDIQGKPEEMVVKSTSNDEEECARSSETEIPIDNSYDGKTVFTVVCAGDYGGAWSKGVYIDDYISSNETVNKNPHNLPVHAASYSLKRLYDRSGQEIEIRIWNLAEHWRYFPVYELYCKSADGAILFWGSGMCTNIDCVLEYKNQVTTTKPDLPVVLLVDNVFKTPTVWMGQGLTINSHHEMDNFCLEHALFAWFEMRERACGEKSVFGQAMSTLINEIIFRSKTPEATKKSPGDTKKPPEATKKPPGVTKKPPKHSCICS